MAETEGVRNFHLNDDTDSSKFAHHHTIGDKYGQAAPGEGYAKLKREFDAFKARMGKVTYWGGTATTSLPNAPASPYTSISGFTNQWGDQPVGLAYTGLGIWTCTVAGNYVYEFNAGLALNSVGRRIAFLYKNGTSDEIRRLNDNAGGVAVSTFNAMTTFKLAVNDTLELRFFQDSGAALNMEQSGNLIENGSDWSRMVIVTALA